MAAQKPFDYLMETLSRYDSDLLVRRRVLLTPRIAGTGTVPRSRDPFQSRDYRPGRCRRSPGCGRLYQSCRHGSAEKPVLQHCSEWGNHALHRYVKPDMSNSCVVYRSRLWRPVVERSKENERGENQDLRAARAKILDMDWRVHPCWVEYVQKGPLNDFDTLFCFLIDLRCGYLPKSIKKTRRLFTRNSDSDLSVLGLLLMQRNVEALKYPRILTPVLQCIEGPHSYLAIYHVGAYVYIHEWRMGHTHRHDREGLICSIKTAVETPPARQFYFPFLGGSAALDFLVPRN